MNLNQITLPVVDMNSTCRFYRVLGCLQIVATDHYARFESPVGDATFSLSLTSEPISAAAIIYFEVDDVDQIYQHLRAKGIVFDEAPADKSWLWRETRLHDPAGNIIKIYHAGKNRRNPPWRVEIRG